MARFLEFISVNYTNALGQSIWEGENGKVYANISFSDAYTQMFRFDEPDAAMCAVVYDGADIEIAVTEITNTMEKWMFG